MLWPTAALTAILFWLGMKAAQLKLARSLRLAFLSLAFLVAMPGILFAAYYTKLLGEPIWLYQFRALPGTELSAAGVGLLAGYFQIIRANSPVLRRQLRKFTVPAILAVVIGAPYVKPLIRPLRSSQLHEHWQNGVCLQSTSSTCGPASAATIVKLLGKEITEAELTRECFTYAGGTENWYLARALRRRGFAVEFCSVAPEATEFPTSAIAGVRLATGSGHFIALLNRETTNYVGADPLTGRFSKSIADLKSDYQFTGFFLLIR